MHIIDNAGRPKVMLEYDATAVWDGAVDSQTSSAIPLSAFKLIEMPRATAAHARNVGF